MTCNKIQVESVEDLAPLLNTENSFRILLNGNEKIIAKTWVQGVGARGANTYFAQSVLSATKTGQPVFTEIEHDNSLLGVFDMILLWLAFGDPYIENALDKESASPLLTLASLFGLDHLTVTIKLVEEKERTKRLETENTDLRRQLEVEKNKQQRQLPQVKLWGMVKMIYRIIINFLRTSVATKKPSPMRSVAAVPPLTISRGPSPGSFPVRNGNGRDEPIALVSESGQDDDVRSVAAESSPGISPGPSPGPIPVRNVNGRDEPVAVVSDDESGQDDESDQDEDDSVSINYVNSHANDACSHGDSGKSVDVHGYRFEGPYGWYMD